MVGLSGTMSSSNTMVPGTESHHESKIKDPNMEDRYTHKYENIHTLARTPIYIASHEKMHI